jgi:hypothetical protein
VKKPTEAEKAGALAKAEALREAERQKKLAEERVELEGSNSSSCLFSISFKIIPFFCYIARLEAERKAAEAKAARELAAAKALEEKVNFCMFFFFKT